MALPTSFQLSVELTKLLPVREALSVVTRPILQQIRELKKTGSDFILEEDLATVFGRAKLDTKMERHFKSAVNTPGFEEIYPSSVIGLASGPGPTVIRALKESHYLSTIIQLSLLGFMHERMTLSSNLVACLNERYRLGVPDSNSDAKYEGVCEFLRVCASQTSNFPWDLYIGLVEAQIPKTCTSMANKTRVDELQWRVLSPNLLLAAMDYLCLVQAFPEDRIMAVPNQAGLVPLVVWAHYTLGLTVLLTGSPDGDILFGQSSNPQVTIKWCDHIEPTDPVYLLDSKMEIILSTELSHNIHARIIAEERCRLKGYGTKLVNRFRAKDDAMAPSSVKLAYITLAFCRVVSPVLYRVNLKGEGVSTPLIQTRDTVESWRLTDAAEIFFEGVQWNEATVDAYTDALKTQTVESLLEDLIYSESDSTANSMQLNTEHLSPLTADTSHIHSYAQFIKMVATILLACSRIVNILDCSDMPLAFCFHGLYSIVRDGIYERLSKWNGKEYLLITEADWFNIAARLLIPHEFTDQPRSNRRRMSLVSAWGWSIFLSNFNDNDPAEIDCQHLYAKRGVPTNSVTKEQKSRILDELWMGGHTPPDPVVLESGGSYIPRCATSVSDPKEYYSSREREFWQTTRFEVRFEDMDIGTAQSATKGKTIFLHASYRELHRALWACVLTESCPHQSQRPTMTTLHDGTVTASGFRWTESPESGICICLVKGNKWARWLVLAGIMGDCSGGVPERNVLLRTDDCCETCASDAARKHGGRWLVII